jgi:hypothetical protein
MSPTTVYRVSFVGPDLTDSASAALDATGTVWDGTESRAGQPCRHRGLVRATTEYDAIATVRRALEAHGSFQEYTAAPVRNAKGDAWRGPFYRSWQEVDWQMPERASLTELERTVLWALMNDHEPTWVIARDPDVHADRAQIEAALQQLEQRKLVDRRMAASGEPGRETESEPWWAITDEGWDLLGFIKSPRYR